MELKVIWKHARAAALECCDGSIYETEMHTGFILTENFTEKQNR